KLELGMEAIGKGQYADGIYHAYSVFVQSAKALLLGEGVACNTQIGIINDFEKHLVATGRFDAADFKEQVLQINAQEPSAAFARQYFQQAQAFYKQAQLFRENNAAAPVTAS
ncbi:MAG TPA: nitrite reductase, partial [Chitinophaga sp.]